MAGIFYKLPEVSDKLRKTEQEIKELVEEGRLHEFRDNGKLFFKVNDVNSLSVDILQSYINEAEGKLNAETETRFRVEAMLEAEAEERLKAEQRAEAEEAAKVEAQENAKANEEALVKAQRDMDAQAEAMAKAEEEISSYKEKIAEIKDEFAGAIANQKEQLESQAAEAIAAAKAESANAITKTKSEFEEKIRSYAQARDEAKANTESEAKLRAEVEERLRAQLEENKKLLGQIEAMELAAAETAVCECCNSEGIPKGELVAINSGQLLCPNCLKALRECVEHATT